MVQSEAARDRNHEVGTHGCIHGRAGKQGCNVHGLPATYAVLSLSLLPHHRYANGSTYSGEWAADQPHGRGEFRDNSISHVVFRGTFDGGRKNGPGMVVEAPRTGGGGGRAGPRGGAAAVGGGSGAAAAQSVVVEGRWEDDVFCVDGPLSWEQARDKARALPMAMRVKWHGKRITYGSSTYDNDDDGECPTKTEQRQAVTECLLW